MQKPAPHSADSLVVGFKPGANTPQARDQLGAVGATAVRKTSKGTALVKLRPGQTLGAAAARLEKRSDVRFVRPNYVARVSDAFIPDDPGRAHAPGGWQDLQWNFVGPFGVNALQAWSRLRDIGAAGGKGVTVAVIDTGLAYERRGRYRRSPDINPHRIVDPYDFVGNDRHPDDANSHGTHVASTIVETTNNHVGVTGLAYGVNLMPLRALDAAGNGDEYTMARAVRYAVRHHAQVINLSLEFPLGLRRSDIPLILSAIRYANARGVMVVAAAGNQSTDSITYPARYPHVVSVGATTRRGCLADYSDWGTGIDLVAPGGGGDYLFTDRRPGSTDLTNCSGSGAASTIYQMTEDGSVRRFGLPGGFEGTSMAAPHVTAAAALVIASGILGPNPRPAAVLQRLESTARDLGVPGYDTRYGFGLIDAGAAVTPSP